MSLFHVSKETGEVISPPPGTDLLAPTAVTGIRRLRVVYVLPSRYDDEGYPLRYWRGVLPSNTLSCLKTLTVAVSERDELGLGIEVSVDIYDDSVEKIPVQKIVRDSLRPGELTIVGMVGVQSNQFPRATDLALQFRQAGVPVLIGGFHVSGILALFDEPTPELQHLIDNGVTLVGGEVEAPGVLAGILGDALHGNLKPIYDIQETPDLCDAAIPQPDHDNLQRFVFKNMGTIDTSRGCPFNCSFCTIINVQGRIMRHRSAESMLESIRRNFNRGINTYFFTDDNLARSPVWEELFDGLIQMRREGRNIGFMMQVDTQAWRTRDFVAKAAEAGCYLVFIGMESINEANLAATGKGQNKVDQYAEMVETWHRTGILVHVGYIIGLPHDTAESVRQEIRKLRDHIKVDDASFFMLAPLPGSRDHLEMITSGVPLDADLNNYDSFHETFRHAHLAPGEWKALYDEAWDTFYNKQSVVNSLLRAPRRRYWRMFRLFIWNRHSMLLGGHPMVTGFLRRKDRKERRALFPRESVLQHAWRRTRESLNYASVIGQLFFEFQEIWLLTRERDDPRWSTLRDLRERWAEVAQRIADSGLAARREVLARELGTTLDGASEQLRRLADASEAMKRSARLKLHAQAQEIDRFLDQLRRQRPTWQQLVEVEHYVAERLVARYEELAFATVGKRRRFNAYRHEMVLRLKSGRIATPKLLTAPRLVLFELVVGFRFSVALLFGR